jgi:hypothetical protein
LPADTRTTAGARALASIGLDGQPLNMHVLVVDDMLLMRRQAENFLRQLGCTCRCARGGNSL